MDWETDLISLVLLSVVVLLYRHWAHSFKPGKEHPSLFQAFARSGGRDPTTFAPTEIRTESSTYEHPRHGLGYILHNRRYLITD